jgi:tetratricopeptide (TPR) repeat protein
MTRRVGVALTLGALLVGAPALAQGAGTVARLKGERLAAQGRCEEALPLLAQARQAAPADARAAFVAGQCQLRLKRYPAAVESLEEARRLAPDDPEIALHLGMARFHLGDLDGAGEALRAADAKLSDRPELDLYLGLLALQRAESAEAEARLERARRPGRGALDPLTTSIATYYEGVAASASGDRRRALASLERVIEENPGTTWAREAEARLRAIRDTRPDRWWVEATLGFEYDDNVVLRGSGVVLPDEIASQNDGRGVWSIEAGYELLQTRDWTVGVLATYYGTAHQDLEDFNTQFPGVSLWADRRLGEHDLARFQYDYGYAWVGGSEPFLSIHTWKPALYHDWGRAGITRLEAAFEKRNYLFSNEDVKDGTGFTGDPCPSRFPCSPRGVDESRDRNRDGWGFTAGFEHTFPLGARSALREPDPNPAPGERNVRFFLSGGYFYHWYSARGTEYSYQGHEVFASLRTLLPWDFAFEATASYQFRPYRNRSTFPDPEDVFVVFDPTTGRTTGVQYGLSGKDRSDDITTVELVLERAITDRITLAARWAYEDNHSNVDVFDYDREVMGLYATFRFGP